MAITIPNDVLTEILVVVGIPVIDITDLEMSSDDIKKLLVFPAMRSYFFWFPIRTQEQIIINESTFSFDFPNATTFGVVDARLSTARYRGMGITGSPFVNANNIAISSRYNGKYGTQNNYNMNLVNTYEKMERASIISTNKAFRVQVDEQKRKLTGFTNVTGELSITWADYSENWSDIPYFKFDDVKKLAQVNILRAFGMLRGQQNSDVPNAFNYGLFNDKADDLEKEVMERWHKMSKPVILRS